MKFLACQFNKVSGPDAVSNYKVEFTVDESQRRGVQNLISWKKGTSLLLVLYDVDKEESSIKELTEETPEDTKKRFLSRIYVLIKQIAKEKNTEPEKIKTTVKDFLKEKKLLKESFTEMDVKQLSAAIYYLQTEYGEDENTTE